MNINYDATQQATNRNDEGQGRQKAGLRQMELPGTMDELQMLLQTEGDRRVSQALKTAYEKWRQEMQQTLEAEKKEAERLVASAIERREREALEKYAGELDEKEILLKQKELEIRIMYFLAGNKLPLEFKDLILDGNEEAALRKADILLALWNRKLEEAVKESVSRMQDSKPIRGNGENR